ncbi:MFS transporter [Sulfurospirillum sp. 1612]|uniref:MFS transporter n=1 Tax=Sulfurospirillum sp. 1612 TaxID=3094835 RepID=UPI002F951741
MNINTFNAFHSRNYRLFFFGQSISMMGTWIQRTAVYWIIYEMTQSAFMLGVAVFATQFPSFLFSLIGGTIADRHNRYKMLLITQIASMIQATLMTLIVFFTAYTVWEILVLSIFLGIINAFDVPTRQSLVHHMVDKKEYLGNAIALNSSMVNLARLIGPAISGILLDQVGAGFCFAINAISFIAVIGSLLMMRLPDYIPTVSSKKMVEDIKEGLSYIKATPMIGMLILLLSLMSFLVLPYITLLPIIAKVSLAGNASTFGYLNSCIGIGAFFGAITLASLKSSINLKKILIAAIAIFAVGLLFFSNSHTLTFAFFFATITGFGMMMQIAIINTLLQTTSSIEMRGRVVSYFAMALFGMQPLGALMVGTLSHYIGAEHTITLQGLIAVIILIVFLPRLRKNQ